MYWCISTLLKGNCLSTVLTYACLLMCKWRQMLGPELDLQFRASASLNLIALILLCYVRPLVTWPFIGIISKRAKPNCSNNPANMLRFFCCLALVVSQVVAGKLYLFLLSVTTTALFYCFSISDIEISKVTPYSVDFTWTPVPGRVDITIKSGEEQICNSFFADSGFVRIDYLIPDTDFNASISINSRGNLIAGRWRKFRTPKESEFSKKRQNAAYVQ